ncbi:MAG: hypothetical protein JXA19_03220 [Anaerolineales bacterium]|nr:hypothetical protein [Anaerolineales bacterium]
MQRREFVDWQEVDILIDNLMTQFDQEFTTMIMITRGGIVPGGMLAEAMDIKVILTAAVDFPAEIDNKSAKLLVWPKFLQFPATDLLTGQQVLVVDDVWGSGRTITAVKNKVSAAGGFPLTAVLHYNPFRSLFGSARPDFFAASTDAHIIYPWESPRGVDGVLKDYLQ